MSKKNSDVTDYIAKVKESNNYYDIKIENIRLKNKISELQLQSDKLPEVKQLFYEYNEILSKKEKELEKYNNMLEEKNKEIERLQKLIQKLPKIIKKFF